MGCQNERKVAILGFATDLPLSTHFSIKSKMSVLVLRVRWVNKASKVPLLHAAMREYNLVAVSDVQEHTSLYHDNDGRVLGDRIIHDPDIQLTSDCQTFTQHTSNIHDKGDKRTQ